MEENNFEFGRLVNIKIPDSIEGTGKVVGLSGILPSGDKLYIVESIDLPIPNPTYPYSTITVHDCFMEDTGINFEVEHCDKVLISKQEFNNKIREAFVFRDLPFEMKKSDMYRLLLLLPDNIYYSVLQNYGLSDTDTSDKFADFMLQNQLDMTFEEYVGSEIAINYLKKGVKIPIDFDKLIKELPRNDR